MKKNNKKKTAEKKPAVKLYKLEKGIKLPEQSHTASGNPPGRVAMTLAAMEVGHSFAITDELEALKAVKVVTDANGRAKTKPDGRKYATRKMKKGIRIWRVS